MDAILLGIIGGPELAVIVVAMLLLFGGKKIPELMRGLGQGIKAFQEGQQIPTEKKDTSEESTRK